MVLDETLLLDPLGFQESSWSGSNVSEPELLTILKFVVPIIFYFLLNIKFPSLTQ